MDHAPHQRSEDSVLEARVAELERELTSIAADLPEKLKQAREEGAEAAREERTEAEDRALEALADALEAARASWEARLSSWESAACGIAKAALEQVFADAGKSAELVEAAIARQLDRLGASSLVGIRVSQDDFADDARLARTAKSLGAGLELKRDPTISSGDCVIDLKLGHMDVAPGAQWQRLAALLERLEREGVSP
jgi:type III secretion protein L